MNRQLQHTGSENGHTLIEVLVASTLFVLFIVGLYGTTSVFFSLLDIQQSRTESLMAMNVARARLIADARGVSTVACAGSDTLELRTTSGGPPQVIEYRSDGSHLVRWVSAEDKTYWVTDRVTALDCDSLGSSGVDVAMAVGTATDSFALHLSLLDLPPGGGS
jgi:type II secretory pathway component PulJ